MLLDLSWIVTLAAGIAIALPSLALAAGLVLLSIRNPSLFAVTAPKLLRLLLSWRR
jgi:hypothetical protein